MQQLELPLDVEKVTERRGRRVVTRKDGSQFVTSAPYKLPCAEEAKKAVKSKKTVLSGS